MLSLTTYHHLLELISIAIPIKLTRQQKNMYLNTLV